jgi:hypothetical protein
MHQCYCTPHVAYIKQGVRPVGGPEGVVPWRKCLAPALISLLGSIDIIMAGQGETILSAFDAALAHAGIHNFLTAKEAVEHPAQLRRLASDPSQQRRKG